jgi:hypothetical protein
MRDPSALTEDDIDPVVHSVEQPARQATVTDCDELSVTNRLLCAHIDADSARVTFPPCE